MMTAVSNILRRTHANVFIFNIENEKYNDSMEANRGGGGDGESVARWIQLNVY